MESIKKALENARNEKANDLTADFINIIDNVCPVGFFDGMRAFNVMKDFLTEYAKVQDEVKYYRNQLKEGKKIEVESVLNCVPSYLDSIELHASFNGLFSLLEVIQAVAYYLPQKNLLSTYKYAEEKALSNEVYKTA